MKFNLSKYKKRNLFFHITWFYLLAFLLWWTFLLYQKTEMHYENSLRYQVLKHTSENNPLDTYLNSEEYDRLLKQFEREKIMIITESFVFSIVLIFLVFQVKKGMEHEIEMSKQQQNFILSITHELKSPLSSIKLMSQTLAKHNLDENQKHKLINNSLSEVNRLQGLVENVLLAAKIDNDGYGFLKKELDLSQLTETLVNNCKTAKNSNIKSDIESGIIFNADKSGMTSIVVNIIENALKYTKGDEVVEVALFKKDDEIHFIVKDKGIGISEVEKTKIFNKFYRVGNEDTRATKGTGLGLYIVKKLVNFHNGEIKVINNTPKGSIFNVIFKL